jgi:hypothetical protein
MKQAEQTRGVPLAGLAIKVTSGFYLDPGASDSLDKSPASPVLHLSPAAQPSAHYMAYTRHPEPYNSAGSC